MSWHYGLVSGGPPCIPATALGADGVTNANPSDSQIPSDTDLIEVYPSFFVAALWSHQPMVNGESDTLSQSASLTRQYLDVASATLRVWGSNAAPTSASINGNAVSLAPISAGADVDPFTASDHYIGTLGAAAFVPIRFDQDPTPSFPEFAVEVSGSASDSVQGGLWWRLDVVGKWCGGTED